MHASLKSEVTTAIRQQQCFSPELTPFHNLHTGISAFRAIGPIALVGHRDIWQSWGG